MKSLKEILLNIIELLNQSDESVWSPITPQEIINNLNHQIKKMDRNEKVDNDILKVEFAPTSTIQEIAMSNGWHDEYLKLSTKFDKEIEKLK